MAESTAHGFSRVDLEGEEYEVKQSAVRNKYAIRDGDGEVVLRGKQKMLKAKEEFPFHTPDEEEAFRVKAEGILDVGGSYTITDAGTEEPVVVLDEDYSILVENWTVRDPDSGTALATIESASKPLSALRHLVGAANLIPNRYEIRDPDGDTVGAIRGEFSLRDTYTVTVDTDGDVPREAVVAAACVIDALENE